MESMSIKTSIVGPHVVSSHTRYDIRVVFSGQEWLVSRRYREFDSLAERLRKEAPQINLPELPPKKFWGNMAAVFVRQRKEQLDLWLDQVLSIPQFSSMYVLRRFLDVPSNQAAESDGLKSHGQVYTDAANKGDFDVKEEKVRLKRIVSQATQAMVEVSDTAQLTVLDANDEDERKADISEALRQVLSAQTAASENFRTTFSSDLAAQGEYAADEKATSGYTDEQRAGLHDLAAKLVMNGFED